MITDVKNRKSALQCSGSCSTWSLAAQIAGSVPVTVVG